MLIKLFLGNPVDFVWQKKWWTIPDQWSPITRSEIGGQLTLACPKLQDTVKRPKPLKWEKIPGPVRQAERVSGLWSEAGSHVKMVQARGRAGPGMCGHWDPGDARSEPLLAWQPGDGWPSRHRPGRPDTHKLICQAGLFRTQYSHSAQHYQHKDALSRLLREQYYASESYSNSYPISVSVIVGKENSG